MQYGLYIGAISGTSMDGIDAVLTDVNEQGCKTIAAHSTEYPKPLKQSLLTLCRPGSNEIESAGSASVQLAELIASTINELLHRNDIRSEHIQAVGSHGQTIRHCADTRHPFSLQIGDPSTIAHHTNITTVADFRMADIAAKGQGAPLAPAFHEAVFADPERSRVVVNLGGIANVTLLKPGQHTIGYDTGPANTLMDQWIQECTQKAYDDHGHWARSGSLIPSLLERMLDEPYLSLPYPKSTGRELFNLEWLKQQLSHQDDSYKNQDVQRTLLEYTAMTLSDAVLTHTGDHGELYLCGGGVNNDFLIERLKALMPRHTLTTTQTLGVHPQHVEAAAFAWLAFRTINRLPGNLKTVTGAHRNKILGGIYQP
ncbi:MAG: anhydro-N-acetylmuramic acid kinase [Oleiphilus sp.]|nr:MAG: anhydro-N-acetylmuramic acid kinase [Oleiphilus sp.]